MLANQFTVRNYMMTLCVRTEPGRVSGFLIQDYRDVII